MLGVKEKKILPLLIPYKTGKSFILTVFTIFFLFFIGVDIVLAKKISSIEEINRQIKKQEKTISAINSNIEANKKKLKNKKEELDAKKESSTQALWDSEILIKKYKLRIVKLERDANILHEQVAKLKDENIRHVKKFENLNVVAKSMERSAHNDALKANDSKIALIQLDLDKINKALTTSNSTLSKTKTVLESQKELSNIYNEENNPDIIKLNQLVDKALIQIRKEKNARKDNLIRLEKLNLANASKKPKVVNKNIRNGKVKIKNSEIRKHVNAGANEKAQTWIYIINGENVVGLGHELGLKDWVKSFGAKYIETYWGNYSGKGENFNSGFIKKFKIDLKNMPENNKLVLIGHGLGGGAAILAATTVAYEKGRVVDLLAVLDPVGVNKLRANIVNQPSVPCSFQNNKSGLVTYFVCLDAAKPRVITSNVKFFYNRWQKDRGVAVDNRRQYSIADGQGNVFALPSVTGKFLVNKNTEANQKRIPETGWSGKNKRFIADARNELTNILAPYLQ